MKRLDQAAGEMREAIAFQAGLRPNESDIVVVPEPASDVQVARDEATRDLAEAEAAQRRAAISVARAVTQLRGAGSSVRDVGNLLGVSYQRVAQLAAVSLAQHVELCSHLRSS